MVPDEYHDFFLGAITVAGALVGLLFVAISVHPGGLVEDDRIALRVRATSALLAFLDALFLSLVALLPDGSVGWTAVGIGTGGALGMVTLLTAVLRRRRHLTGGELRRTLSLVVGQGAVYGWQVVEGLRLARDPAGHPVTAQAVLIIVFFGFGVFRAWEFVGGPRTGIGGTLDELRHRTETTAPAAEEG